MGKLCPSPTKNNSLSSIQQIRDVCIKLHVSLKVYSSLLYFLYQTGFKVLISDVFSRIDGLQRGVSLKYQRWLTDKQLYDVNSTKTVIPMWLQTDKREMPDGQTHLQHNIYGVVLLSRIIHFLYVFSAVVSFISFHIDMIEILVKNLL